MKLGREIIIPSDTELKEAPKKIDLIEKHYSILIGIGKNHTAELIISESSLNALKENKNELEI